MALSTQIFLLCLCSFVADSYYFDLGLFDSNVHDRIPLDLPSPFRLYHGMFDHPRTVPPPLKKDSARGVRKHINTHSSADVTTLRNNDVELATETSETPASSDEDIFVNHTEDDIPENFLMKNVKVNEPPKWQTEDKSDLPPANALSIHQATMAKSNPILSVKISDDNEEDTSTEGPETNSGETNATQITNDNDNKDDIEISKQNDFFLIPVTAVNPSVLSMNQIPFPNGNINSLVPMASSDSVQTSSNNQGTVPQSGGLNNANTMTQVPFGNQPNQFVNVGNPALQPFVNLPNQFNNVPNNLYYVTMPNNGQAVNNLPSMYYLVNQNPMNNIGYPTANSQPMYNLVRVDNLSSNLVRQPNNFVPFNNQQTYIPFNNQANNFVPLTNQPSGYIPLNNNYSPVNNQPLNLVPLNSNNFVPFNDQANFVPMNSNNFAPVNNQQSNGFVPTSIVPNNFAPYQPNNNYVQLNNLPSNMPLNNQATNFVPLNDQQSGIVSLEQPSNVVSLTPDNNVLVAQSQPVTILRLKDEDEQGKDDNENIDEKKFIKNSDEKKLIE